MGLAEEREDNYEVLWVMSEISVQEERSVGASEGDNDRKRRIRHNRSDDGGRERRSDGAAGTVY